MFGCHVVKGSKVNEDAALAFEEKNTFTLSIADGHGQKGEGMECSLFCMKQSRLFTEWLLQQPFREWTEEKWITECTSHYQKTHDEYRLICAYDSAYAKEPRTIDNNIVRSLSGKAIHSGSTYSRTFTFPFEDGYRTILSHVGDSDIYINGVCMSEDTSPLNVKTFHRLQSFPEKERLEFIYNSPGLTIPEKQKQCPRIYDTDGTKKNIDSSFRLIYSNARYIPSTYFISPEHYIDNVCIAMSSSIGDYYAHAIGLTCIPVVKIIDTKQLPSIVIGSDGAWDLIDGNEIWKDDLFYLGGVDMQLSRKKHNSIQKAVEEQIFQLRRLAHLKFGSFDIDDISLSVLFP